MNSVSVRIDVCCSAGVENGKPTHFTVFTKGAGKAPLDVRFSSPVPGEAVTDLDIIDNYDYSHTVRYTPIQQVRLTPVARQERMIYSAVAP